MGLIVRSLRAKDLLVGGKGERELASPGRNEIAMETKGTAASDFVFEFEETLEIHRDPGGHYHHFTVLVGRLLEGTLRSGSQAMLDTTHGPVATVVLHYQGQWGGTISSKR